MTEIKPKPAHTGLSALPYGETVYVLRRKDHVVYGAWQTRHEAVGAITKFRDTCDPAWFEVVPVRVGEYRLRDWININEVFE